MADNTSTGYRGSVLYDGLDGSVMAPVYLLTSVLVMISNAIVIIVILLTDQLHFPSLWNIAFMAFCDFSMGLFYLVCAVPSMYLQQFAYDWNFALLTSIIHVFLHGQNNANVLLATVDRYLAICRPLKYHLLMSPKRFALSVIASIVLNICRLIIVFVPNEEILFSKSIAISHPKYSNPASIIAAVGIPAILVITILIFILKIFAEISRSGRRISDTNNATVAPPSSHQLSITMLISGGMFSALYIPSYVVIICAGVLGGAKLPPKLLVQLAAISFLSNSLWNVIIYALAFRPFREAWMRIFCKAMERRQRQAEVNATFRQTNQRSDCQEC